PLTKQSISRGRRRSRSLRNKSTDHEAANVPVRLVHPCVCLSFNQPDTVLETGACREDAIRPGRKRQDLIMGVSDRPPERDCHTLQRNYRAGGIAQVVADPTVPDILLARPAKSSLGASFLSLPVELLAGDVRVRNH